MNRLRSETVGKVAKGLRPLSKIVGVSKMTVSRILTDNNITKLKRKTTPRVTQDQEIRQQSRLRKLRRTLFQSRDRSIIVMDDESYFKFRDDHYSKHYYSDGNDVDDKIKYQSREKFPHKLMIWMAISVKGRSEPYFHESKGAVNANVYINEILAKHLVPFINKSHSGQQIIFWHDLASAHYARVTQQWLRDLAISFVDKELNPPAAPQVRPIERFWNHLKAKVYEDGWEAERRRSTPYQKKKPAAKTRRIDGKYMSTRHKEKDMQMDSEDDSSKEASTETVLLAESPDKISQDGTRTVTLTQEELETLILKTKKAAISDVREYVTEVKAKNRELQSAVEQMMTTRDKDRKDNVQGKNVLVTDKSGASPGTRATPDLAAQTRTKSRDRRAGSRSPKEKVSSSDLKFIIQSIPRFSDGKETDVRKWADKVRKKTSRIDPGQAIAVFERCIAVDSPAWKWKDIQEEDNVTENWTLENWLEASTEKFA